jgi:hypothetical protein
MKPVALLLPSLPEMSPLATANTIGQIVAFAATRSLDFDYFPTLTAVDRDPAVEVQLEYDGDADHRAATTATAAVWLRERHSPVEVLWISDSFMRVFKPAAGDPWTEDTPSPSEDPASVEAMVCTYASPAGVWTTQMPYHRGDDGEVGWDKADPWLRHAIDGDGDGYRHGPMPRAVGAAVGLGPPLPPEIRGYVGGISLDALAALGIHPQGAA